MRPNTLAGACRRAQVGVPWDKSMGEFLQSYYLAANVEARAEMLVERPPPFDDPRFDALVGGMAEYLFKRWAPDHPPPWVGDRDRYLDRPFFPVGDGNAPLMEYFSFASPAEFKSRNVMLDEEPLRRAAQPPVEPIRGRGGINCAGE